MLADDFLTLRMLVAKTGMTTNQVSASLSHLRSYHVVDVIETEGGLWWFLTPDTDTRSRVVEERTPEDSPRRPRRRKVTKPAE